MWCKTKVTEQCQIDYPIIHVGMAERMTPGQRIRWTCDDWYMLYDLGSTRIRNFKSESTHIQVFFSKFICARVIFI